MHVAVAYTEGCPHREIAEVRVREALDRLGHSNVEINLLAIESDEQAHRMGFRGSPTVFVDGVDLFDDPSAAVGLSCRLYRTPEGLAGSPTVDHVIAALQQS